MAISTPCLAGADVGTTNCKAVVIDRTGRILASSQVGYPTRFPRPGWAEQDPEDWHRTFVQAVRECIAAAGISPAQILALGLCGPAHNVVLLDSAGHVLRPVILWSDRRSTAQASWLHDRHGELIFRTTYQPVNPSWTLSQLLWIRHHEPDIWRRIHRVVIGKDYLTYRLTGSWQTDWYDALGTQLFDARLREWSGEICDVLQLPGACLPPVTDATMIAGKVTRQAACDTGLAEGTLVAVGSGDSSVEALGVGVVEPGQCIVKLGTSGTVNLITALPRPHPQTMTYYHLPAGRWCTIAATNSGAAAASWFGQAFNLGGDNLELAAAIDRLSAPLPPGSEGLIFHPYLQGERSPHWDPHLRGSFVGITVQHHQGHFARAVLEGVAFSLRECLDLLRGMDLPISQTRIMGGGARSAVWRQIVADVLHTELLLPDLESTAYGAALVAGVAGGLYSDVLEAARVARPVREVVVPGAKAVACYERLYPLYKRITQSLTPICHTLSDLYMNTAEGDGCLPT